MLLASLTAADYRLGKAYGLGRALADTCRKPTDQPDILKEFGPYRIANLLSWLDDLSTALPPHAAHSVATSLQSWTTWAGGLSEGQITDDALRALRRQGELWRALLGEKHGTEMLEIDNYLDAARDLASQMHSILIRTISRFKVLTAVVAALLAAGVTLLVIGGSSQIVAGAGSLLAMLGLTWKDRRRTRPADGKTRTTALGRRP